jgi:hypothetical protein
MSARRLHFVPGLILACLVIGCGAPAGSLVPVKGTLLVDGKPLDGVTVMLFPDAAVKNCRGGTGKTTATGTFEVTDIDQNLPGLPAGKYTVAYSRLRMPDGAAAPEPGTKSANPGLVSVETFPSHLLSPDVKLPTNQVEIPKTGATKLELNIRTDMAVVPLGGIPM